MSTQPEDFDAASVREAALAAMKTQGLGQDNWPQDPDADGPAPAAGVQDPPGSQGDEGGAPETPPAGEVADQGEPEVPAEDSVPTEYFGLDLSGLPALKRQEVIEAFKKQDRFIQSLQRNPEGQRQEPQAPPPPAEEEPEPLTDDDIMESLGVSKDDPMYEVKKEMMVPLAKPLLETAQQMQQFAEQQMVQQFITHWETTLDQMEKDYGKLPLSREELAVIAEKEGIVEPELAYARVALEGRANLEKLRQEALTALDAERKEGGRKPPTTVRPGSETPADTKPVTPPALLDPRAAALAAAESTGIDWGETLRAIN